MENEEIKKVIIEIPFNKNDKKLLYELFTKMETEIEKYSYITITKEQCKVILNYVQLLENALEGILDGLEANIIGW